MNRKANYAAPFGVTCGATIKNLHVDGTIVTDHKFAAGIVAYSNNIGNQTTRIINCISSVYINCDNIVTVNASKPNDCTHGGLVGQNEKEAFILKTAFSTVQLEILKQQKPLLNAQALSDG